MIKPPRTSADVSNIALSCGSSTFLMSFAQVVPDLLQALLHFLRMVARIALGSGAGYEDLLFRRSVTGVWTDSRGPLPD